VDRAGNIYIVESNALDSRVRKVSAQGTISTLASGFYFPTAVAVDAAGNVYVADTGNHLIRKISPLGTVSTVAGDQAPRFAGDGGPATSGSLFSPEGVAVDAAGNLYIADKGNRRVRKVTSGGIISTLAGGPEKFAGDGVRPRAPR